MFILVRQLIAGKKLSDDYSIGWLGLVRVFGWFLLFLMLFSVLNNVLVGMSEGCQPDSTLDPCTVELNETIDAVTESSFDNPEVADGIGDMLVTIIIASKMLKLDPTYCLSLAYDEIKDRKGKMVDGKFVKEK